MSHRLHSRVSYRLGGLIVHVSRDRAFGGKRYHDVFNFLSRTDFNERRAAAVTELGRHISITGGNKAIASRRKITRLELAIRIGRHHLCGGSAKVIAHVDTGVCDGRVCTQNLNETLNGTIYPGYGPLEPK
jgi:hypothetical protein